MSRLLWVDDEIDLLRPHILFLEKKGYTVATALSGADALDLIRREAFDLVLLDENMPGLSGLETLSRLKDLRPTIPVVMVTKNEAEDIMNQAIGQKIADYLIKPVNPSQVLLTLKRNIHQREIVQEVAGTNYREEFQRTSMLLSERLTADEWKDLHRRIVRWELELTEAGDETLLSMLRMQKEEANAAFLKFIRREYEGWVEGKADAPLMSVDVMRREVLPRIDEGRKVFLIVLDNFRFDQWRMLSPDLSSLFDINEDVYYSILPTATQYARNSLFAGLWPAEIRRLYPDLWVDEEQDEGKNNEEEELIRRQLARLRHSEVDFSYQKINDSAAATKFLPSLSAFMHKQLGVLVINFIDILSHARTESQMVRELAGGEAAYRSLTRSWFQHSAVREIFTRLAAQDCDILLTTDHGSILVDAPIKVVGDRNVNTNLRYKLGKNLAYPAKEVLEAKRPAAYGLPTPNLSTTYIFAPPHRFFAYPNNYNHYVQYYRSTFQHGGVSMEEMLIPLVWLTPKASRARI